MRASAWADREHSLRQIGPFWWNGSDLQTLGGADQVGEQLIQAPVGTLVVKPRGIQHCFWNAGSAPARLLEIITPAGLEQYFEELASLVSSGGPPDPARRSALYEKYHLTVDRAKAEVLLEHYHLKF